MKGRILEVSNLLFGSPKYFNFRIEGKFVSSNWFVKLKVGFKTYTQ